MEHTVIRRFLLRCRVKWVQSVRYNEEEINERSKGEIMGVANKMIRLGGHGKQRDFFPKQFEQ